MMRILRLSVALASLVTTLTSLYAQTPLPPGMRRYIVVLRPAQQLDDAEILKAGGTIVTKARDRRVINIPAAALAVLRKHPAVYYLQRVWLGEPSSDLSESANRLQPTSDAVETTDANSLVQWDSGTFGYDESGNITAIGTDTYGYDSASRIVKAQVNAKTETYGYDSFGNLVTKSTIGSAVILPPVDAASNRVSGFEYDAAGNLTSDGFSAMLYDPVNMMVSLVPSIGNPQERRFLYTADDERIGAFINGSSYAHWTFRDFDGHVLSEYDGWSDDPTWLWVEDYVYRDEQLLAAEKMGAEGGRRHFHLDHLGSPRVVSNQQGLKLARHDFWPFGIEQTFLGQEVTEHGYNRPEPMAFTGHERDFLWAYDIPNDNYLDYMHARTYLPQLGRFLSVDPVIDVKRAMRRPQAWNRYAYVENNPINMTDPDGRCPTCPPEENMAEIQAMAAAGDPLAQSMMRNTGRLEAPLIDPVDFAAGGFGLGLRSLARATTTAVAETMFESAGKGEILQGLRSGAGRMTAEQRAVVIRSVQRATTKESVTVIRHSNGTISILKTRPGADGAQMMITRVYGNGAEATVQTANNAAGQLVHYDPKKTYWWDTIVQWFSGAK